MKWNKVRDLLPMMETDGASVNVILRRSGNYSHDGYHYACGWFDYSEGKFVQSDIVADSGTFRLHGTMVDIDKVMVCEWAYISPPPSAVAKAYKDIAIDCG